MSRIGKKPILIPEGVEVKIEGNKIIVKGPKGELQKEVRPEIKVEMKDSNPPSTLPPKGRAPNKIFVIPRIETPKQNKFATGQAKKTEALWGLTRALISNMVKGVKEDFEKKLEIQGLGYKATLEVPNTGGPDLILSVGFSHPIKIKAPPSIKFSVEKNIITVSGIDKELVGQIAAKIRKARPPEPYKGKGIRYLGEVIRRKAGKKVVTAGT